MKSWDARNVFCPGKFQNVLVVFKSLLTQWVGRFYATR